MHFNMHLRTASTIPTIITVQTAVKVIICALLGHPSIQQEAKLQEYKLHISSGQLLFCSRVNSNVHIE